MSHDHSLSSDADNTNETYPVIEWESEEEVLERFRAAEAARKAQERARKARAGQYREYLHSDNWRVIRDAAMKRAKCICEKCHKNRAAEVHHLTYKNRGHERAEDLIALCQSCHQKAHGISNSMRARLGFAARGW